MFEIWLCRKKLVINWQKGARKIGENRNIMTSHKRKSNLIGHVLRHDYVKKTNN